jgi:general secretion pathway protein K
MMKKNSPSHKENNKGVALITAMMIVAITGIISTNLLWDNILDTRRTMTTLNRDQAIQVALGAESWIMKILKDDALNTQSDHLNEFWAKDLPALPIDGGDIFGQITDLQSRFNLNNLVKSDGSIDQDQFEHFQRLLKILNIEANITAEIIDWIDPDQYPTFPGGAEDDNYTKLTPPYRTANQPMISTSEILSLNSVNPYIYKTLKPHITALPVKTRINVNTANTIVLQSLDNGITKNDAQRLITERMPSGFGDVSSSFKSLLLPENLTKISDNSNYFQLKLMIRIDTVTMTMFSNIKRDQNGNTSILMRSFGST